MFYFQANYLTSNPSPYKMTVNHSTGARQKDNLETYLVDAQLTYQTEFPNPQCDLTEERHVQQILINDRYCHQ